VERAGKRAEKGRGGGNCWVVRLNGDAERLKRYATDMLQ